MPSMRPFDARLRHSRGQVSSEYLVLAGLVVATILILIGLSRSGLGGAVTTLGARIYCGLTGSACSSDAGAAATASRGESATGSPTGPAPSGLAAAPPAPAGAPARAGGRPVSASGVGGSVAAPGGSSSGFWSRVAGGWRTIAYGAGDGLRSIGSRIGSIIDSVSASISGGSTASTSGVPASPLPSPAVTTGLGADVDRLVSQSPELTAQVKRLQAAGYVIESGFAGAGTYHTRDTKTITIDADDLHAGDPANVVLSLAHEMGHADYDTTFSSIVGVTHTQFVEGNLRRMLDGEGEAILREFEVRDSFIAVGAPLTPAVGSAHAAEYEAIYRRYLQDGDRQRARRDIGAVVEYGESPSGTDKTYHDHYTEMLEMQWQAANQRGGWPPLLNVPA